MGDIDTVMSLRYASVSKCQGCFEVQDVTVAERWTQERRREHTRNLLLDAAKEAFSRKGFEGASLEEIAEAAGYTRGAIYKHFSALRGTVHSR